MPEMTEQERAEALASGRSLTTLATEHTARLSTALGRQSEWEHLADTLWSQDRIPPQRLDTRNAAYLRAPPLDPATPRKAARACRLMLRTTPRREPRTPPSPSGPYRAANARNELFSRTAHRRKRAAEPRAHCA